MNSSNHPVRFADVFKRSLLIVIPIFLLITVLLDLVRHRASWSLAYLTDKAVSVAVFWVVYSLGMWWFGRETIAQNPTGDRNA
jgi:hypothetical protein